MDPTKIRQKQPGSVKERWFLDASRRWHADFQGIVWNSLYSLIDSRDEEISETGSELSRGLT